MTKRMTKREMFAMVMEVVENSATDNKAEMINFINHELELLNRKSGKSGQTKTQKENEILKAEILEVFKEFDEPVTISEFCERTSSEIGNLSNQKLSAMFNQLAKANLMVKTIDKKKSYFSLA
ncbi:MAG: hypothetical protein IKW30_10930 [Lachnospiraceae bacterium]|nr:hypothetical protein [Lachnospiraceae bacterium]